MADDEEEVFEIDDFTVASEWERFINRIDEIIGANGWKLEHTEKKQTYDSKNSGEWTLTTAELKFYNIDFLLTYRKLNALPQSNPNLSTGVADELPQALLDSVDFQHDFLTKSFPITRWYGLKEFMILSPLTDTNQNESKIHMLWSSISIALSNSKCHVPMFIQIGDLQRKLYFGTCIGGGFRTSYEIVQLKYTPHECRHVQGMIDTFKSKLGCPLSSPITVSIRFAYSIRDWPEEMWFQAMPDTDSEFGFEVGISSLERMPFGSLQDPVRDFQVAAIWPYLSSDILVDDENTSLINALQAPVWKLKARGCDTAPSLLSEALLALFQLCQQKSNSTKQIIRSLSTDYQEETEGLSGNVGHVLDRLADSSIAPPSLPKQFVPNAERRVVKTVLTDSPLPEQLLIKTLEHLFRDAGATEIEALEVRRRLDNEQRSLECDTVRNKDKFRHLKTAPVGSLTYNLALCVAILDHGYGGVEAVAHIWHEFILEMRYRFENNIMIPGIAQTAPNLNYCIIHQKLQMLNCCIKRAVLRNQDISSTSSENFKRMESETSYTSCASVSYKDYSLADEQNRHGSELLPSKSPKKKDAVWGDLLFNLEVKQDGGPSCENKKDKTWSELLSNIEPSTSSINKRDNNKSGVNKTSVSYSDISADREMSDGFDEEEETFESDDEFFEAQEEVGTNTTFSADASMTEAKTTITTTATEDIEELAQQATDDSNREPDGVSSETDMKLLCTGKPLCVPITQEAPLLTEDMLLEQQDVMTRLGSSAEGSRVRVLMQCASLNSDMEAFKAANPGCILEDFVRWYSPNDWLPGSEPEEQREEIKRIMKEKKKKEQSEKDSEGWEFELDDDVTDIVISEPENEWGKEGHLSLRMLLPGNTWREIWDNAKPIPARRQKRLFDDTKEAEKVLHFFDNLRPSELILHLLPIILQASVVRVCEEDDSFNLDLHTDEIIKSIAQLQTSSLEDLPVIEKTINALRWSETRISTYHSLRAKLYDSKMLEEQETDDELETFIRQLLDKNEVNIKGAAKSRIGKIMIKLLHHQKMEEDVALNLPPRHVGQEQRESHSPQTKMQIPTPIGQEYILRTYASRPSHFSRPTPQRLFTVIMPEEFRMAGSFTQDTTFI